MIDTVLTENKGRFNEDMLVTAYEVSYRIFRKPDT